MGIPSVFVVPFRFTGESVIIMHMRVSAYVNIFFMSAGFCATLALGHPLGVLRSPAFSWVRRAAAPVHALSLHW